jgi:hypothetical protein
VSHNKTNSGSEQIVEQIDNMCTKVHDHTISSLDNLIKQLEGLKKKVSEKRLQMATYTKEFISLADAALKSGDNIEHVTSQLEKHLEGN